MEFYAYITKYGLRTPYPACKSCYAKTKREKYWANPEKERRTARVWKKKQRNEVSDWYCKSSILDRGKSTLRYGDITPELVEMQRLVIKLHRANKKRKEGI